MEIKKIDIYRYKSIQKETSVLFFQNEPTVLIGKNGSGKTNILEAIESVFSKDRLPDPRRPIPKFGVHLQLSKEEFQKLFPTAAYVADENTLIAYNGENSLKIEKIQSKKLCRC